MTYVSGCDCCAAQVLEDVRAIIAEQLGANLEKVEPTSKFVDLGADSLDTVEIMMALEEKFDLQLDEEVRHAFILLPRLHGADPIVLPALCCLFRFSSFLHRPTKSNSQGFCHFAGRGEDRHCASMPSLSLLRCSNCWLQTVMGNLICYSDQHWE